MNAAWVTAIAAVLTVLLPLFFYYRSTRPKKLLIVTKLSYTSLATIHDDIKGKILLTYDGKPVPGVSSISIELFNAGSSPLKIEDFHTPLNFKFGKKIMQ